MPSNPLSLIRYYVWSSYRRKLLDHLLTQNRDEFFGIVLDIGGRDRGRFVKPKQQVEKWIFADINPIHKPDIVLDVGDMRQIDAESIDVISACELFEHVEQIEKGLDECRRVLKRDGKMIISIPFLYAIHADPSDYQRWTEYKWKSELEKRNLQVETLLVMGRYFTVMADSMKTFYKSLPKPLNWLLFFVSPLLDMFVALDSLPLIQKHPLLGKFHGGYFMIVRKI